MAPAPVLCDNIKDVTKIDEWEDRMDSHLQALSSGTVAVSEDEVAALRSALRGGVLLPGEAGYDEARKIWNAMIDRRPGGDRPRCGAADVVQAVDFAREHGCSLAVRGGGHNIAGNAVCDGGIDDRSLADARRAGRPGRAPRPC